MTLGQGIFTNLDLNLKMVGIGHLVVFILSLLLPHHFGWKREMARVSTLARQVFFVHGFFIAMLVLGLGLLTLFFTTTLIEPSKLATLLLGFLAAFWGIRLYMQLFVYERSLWRGHRFNTRVHIVFTVMWLYTTAVYGFAFWHQLQHHA